MRLREFVRSARARKFSLAGGLLLVLVLAVFAIRWEYARLSRLVDTKLAGGTLGAEVELYSAPRVLAVKEFAEPEDIIRDLTDSGTSYRREGDRLIVTPASGPQATIAFRKGQIAAIQVEGADAGEYALAPQPLATLGDGSLGQRRLVRYAEIPRQLVHALLSAEDKNFFHHAGFDPIRVIKAAMVNLRSGRKEQGGSTLTMQLARSLYLDQAKTWRRKLREVMIAAVIEWKFSKEQILENYVNFVYLGRAHHMDVRGFAQASESFLGKPLSQVTTVDAALLAGLVQRPSYYDPLQHPDRAIARRNLVLRLMHQNGYLDARQFETAKAAPFKPAPGRLDASTAPWFLDLALEDLKSQFPDGLQARVYTTLDPALQRAAAEAVAEGMRALDKRLRNRKTDEKPQVALVALDSRTGEVKALIGGRDYDASQLNHARAMRQPGSSFKPFVYASAFESDLGITPASTVEDVPTSFLFNGEEYAPSNFGDRFYGTVTLRRALARSMNIATISLAQQVGYKRVLETARQCGLNDRLGATPALALGAYEATPVEMAASYTAFANSGFYVKPRFIHEVRAFDGSLKHRTSADARRVLSVEAAFLVQDMLQEVVRSGTAASASRHLKGPAAGKTGTSRDGWFVGFVSNLVCAVWVGYDSNQDLNLEGSKSALPIWTAFMKRAGQRAVYRKNLSPRPSRIVALSIDADTGLLAGADCPARHEYFIRGTEPSETCDHGWLQPVPASFATAAQ